MGGWLDGYLIMPFDHHHHHDQPLADEDEGPWAPQKEDRVVTELEAGTLTEEQKRFRCVVFGG